MKCMDELFTQPVHNTINNIYLEKRVNFHVMQTKWISPQKKKETNKFCHYLLTPM